MKKLATAISLAALLGAGSYAIAQDAGVGVDAGAGVSVETPAGDVDTDVNADASMDAGMDNSYESLTSAIAGSANTDLSAVTDEASVEIVLLSSLAGEAGPFEEAFAANAEGNATLHGNIAGNAAISAKLQAEGYTADDVVAVQTNADGSVKVFVDDRA